MDHEEARRILPVAKISANSTDRFSANTLHARFTEILLLVRESLWALG
jgi:hypothetical protein